MLKFVQKIVLNGSSSQVTIPRALMHKLELRPGELLEVSETEDGGIFIRPFQVPETRGIRSPGRVVEHVPTVKP